MASGQDLTFGKHHACAVYSKKVQSPIGDIRSLQLSGRDYIRRQSVSSGKSVTTLDETTLTFFGLRTISL